MTKQKYIFIFIISTLLLNSCSNSRVINNFSKKIAENTYGVFWQGFMAYEQDTLFFQFVGDVGYRVPTEENEDILYFKSKAADPLVITREVKDALNRPAPAGKGKEMTKWSFIGDQSLIKDLEKVIKNGDIEYFHLSNNENKNIKTMKKLYGLNNQESQRILNKMYNP